MEIVGTGRIEVPAGERERTAKLADGARQFEAMMLEQMLKTLHFGSAPGEGLEEDASGANGTLQGFGTQALAGSIARGSGFGIAQQIIRQVTAEADSRQVGKGGKV